MHIFADDGAAFGRALWRVEEELVNTAGHGLLKRRQAPDTFGASPGLQLAFGVEPLRSAGESDRAMQTRDGQIIRDAQYWLVEREFSGRADALLQDEANIDAQGLKVLVQRDYPDLDRKEP
jgi:hypothetical protein